MGTGAPGAAAVSRWTRRRPGRRPRPARPDHAAARRFFAECDRDRQDVAGVERKAARRARRGVAEAVGTRRVCHQHDRRGRNSPTPTSSCPVMPAELSPIGFWVGPQPRVHELPLCRAATISIPAIPAACPAGSTGRGDRHRACDATRRAGLSHLDSGYSRAPSRRKTAYCWARLTSWWLVGGSW